MRHPSNFLAMFLATGSAAFASRVGDISESESVALERRVKTKNLKFLGFGPGAITGLGSSGYSYHLQGGWWREAHPNAAIRILSDLDFRSGWDAWKASAGIGAVWLPSRGLASPFVGFDFGWGIADGEEAASGFALGTSIGLQLFRTATTQLSLEGRSSLLLERAVGIPWSNSFALSVHF